MREKAGAARNPTMRCNSFTTVAIMASSFSERIAPSSMPPRKQRSRVVPQQGRPAGHAVRELGAHPGAGHQTAAFALGDQKAEAIERLRKSAVGEAERNGHR